MKTVLLIGATGNLGRLIGQALVAKQANLRLLVRPGSRAKLDPALAAAATLFESDAGAYQGVETVISAVQGGPETIIDAQLQMLAHARAAGVKRFIPSDYSYNFFALADGDNFNSDWRRAFAERAEAARGPVEVVHVMNGCFLDRDVLFGFLGAFDLARGEAYLWGDGQQKMEFTTYADTAAYTAEAALAEGPVGRDFFVAGDSLTFPELIREVEAGLGRPLTVRHLGSLDDLEALTRQRLAAEPNNYFAWLPLMYWRAMLNGKGHLGPLRNAHYPAIRPTGVRDYVTRNLSA